MQGVLQFLKEYKIEVGLLILSLLFVGTLASSLQSLGGPIYGGDVYRDRSMIMNIIDGWDFWTSSYFHDHAAYYSWLPHIIVALSTLIGFSIERGYTLILPLLGAIVNFIGGFIATKNIIPKRGVRALLATGLAISTPYTFSRGSLVGLIALYVYFFSRAMQGERKAAWHAGITLGVISLVRMSEFVVLAVVSFLYVFILWLSEKNKIKQILPYVQQWYPFLSSLAFAGLIIIPIGLYHGFHTLNPVYTYGERSLDVLGFGWMLSGIQKYFFTFKFPNFIFSALKLLGLYYIARSALKKEKIAQAILLFSFTPLLLSQHHHITHALFDWSFLPSKFLFLSYMNVFYFAGGIALIIELIAKKKSLQKSKITEWSGILVASIVLLITLSATLDVAENSFWIINAREPITSYLDFGGQVASVTPNDQHIAAHPESGFMIAAMSGEKVLTARRTHVSYYVDIDQRMADLAVLLYSNNSESQQKIREQYQIDYVYLDNFLLSSPLYVLPDKVPYLQQNGVAHQLVYERLDRAVADASVFELAQIPFQNITLAINQTPQAALQLQGQIAGALFRIQD